ncbi:hypothetical protein ABID70_001394 [Clavibacter michiganensis]
MSQPVVVTAVFTPVEGKHDEAVAALSRGIAEVHEERRAARSTRSTTPPTAPS